MSQINRKKMKLVLNIVTFKESFSFQVPLHDELVIIESVGVSKE